MLEKILPAFFVALMKIFFSIQYIYSQYLLHFQLDCCPCSRFVVHFHLSLELEQSNRNIMATYIHTYIYIYIYIYI